MSRNSVCTLCVLLLCSGFALSQSQTNSNIFSPPEIPSIVTKTSQSTVQDKVSTEKTIVPSTEKTTSKTAEPSTTQKSTTAFSTTENPTPEQTKTTVKPANPTTKPTEKPTEKPTDPTAKPTEKPTSPAPTSSTPIPVTPTPDIGPQKGNWSISENNKTCIVIEGIFVIRVDYEIKHKNEKTSNSTTEYVPKHAIASGSCNNAKITLSWVNGTLEFDFTKNVTQKKYALTGIHISLLNIPGHNKTTYDNNGTLKAFETPLNQSYSCAATKQIQLSNNAKFTLEEFHLQAFKISNGTGFDTSMDCAGSGEHTPDIVPIIVGCVLAILVISVLVAYLVSRRRSQTRGYLSM